MNRTAIRRFLKRHFSCARRAENDGWSHQQLLAMVAEQLNARRCRRDFLKEATATALALSACRTVSPRGSLTKTASPRDVVILGGGLAGLTAAHDLLGAGIIPTLYEAQDRLGGRVLTKKHFNKDGMFIEQGATYIDPEHYALLSLALELGVELEPFFDERLGLVPEIYFLDGKVADPESYMAEFRKLAKLIDSDTQNLRDGNEILLPTPGKPGPQPRLDQISLAAYLAEKKAQGVSSDLIKMIDVMYLSMYGLDTSEQSAYNLLTLVDTRAPDMALLGDSEASLRVRGGSSQIVEALHKKVAAKAPVLLGHRLVRMRDEGVKLALDFEVNGKVKTVRADQVICTLPFSVLRYIEGVKALPLSPAKMAAIHQLGYATSSQFTLGFGKRKWRDKGNLVPPNLGTVYSDGLVKELRDPSNNQPGTSGILTHVLNGKQGALVSQNITSETLDALETMYPGIKLLTDGNHALKHWASDLFALGSFACPRVGHYALMGGYENPVELAGRLLFAGEHMSSDTSGYMEGAIKSGKVAVEQILKAVS